MKKKNITSRAVDSFSASFAHRKPFDSPRPSTTNAVPLPLLYFVFLCRFEAIWIGFAILS